MSEQARHLRDDYRHFHAISTRWHDNDLYGHVNNVTYYSFFDTAVNAYLIHHGGLDIHDGEVVGFVVSSSCDYFASIAFPDASKSACALPAWVVHRCSTSWRCFAVAKTKPALPGVSSTSSCVAPTTGRRRSRIVCAARSKRWPERRRGRGIDDPPGLLVMPAWLPADSA